MGAIIAGLLLIGIFCFAWWVVSGFCLPSRYPEWCKHQIIKQKSKTGPMSKLIPHQFVCQICLQSWSSAETVSGRCPGLPTYSWPLDDKKPAYLVTAEELEVCGYQSPSGPPFAYLKAELYPSGSEYTPLYDERKAERVVVALPKP